MALLFVVVEDMDSAASWSPAPHLLLECGRILLWEAAIDVVKHAVLGKFNDIRPGIYRYDGGQRCCGVMDTVCSLHAVRWTRTARRCRLGSGGADC